MLSVNVNFSYNNNNCEIVFFFCFFFLFWWRPSFQDTCNGRKGWALSVVNTGIEAQAATLAPM